MLLDESCYPLTESSSFQLSLCCAKLISCCATVSYNKHTTSNWMGFFSKCQTIPGSSIRKYLTFHPNDSEERLSPSDHQQIYGHDINRLSVHRPVIIPAVNFSAAMTWGGSIKLFDGALWSFLVNKPRFCLVPHKTNVKHIFWCFWKLHYSISFRLVSNVLPCLAAYLGKLPQLVWLRACFRTKIWRPTSENIVW